MPAKIARPREAPVSSASRADATPSNQSVAVAYRYVARTGSLVAHSRDPKIGASGKKDGAGCTCQLESGMPRLKTSRRRAVRYSESLFTVAAVLRAAQCTAYT